MPWKPSDADDHKKGLTPKQRQVWARVANDALARCRESGGNDCEAKAIRQANAAATQATEMSESALWFAERAHTGFLVALWLDPETAGQLAVDGGESPDALHVTLCYCGDADELGDLAVARAIAAVEQAVRWRSPLEGRVAGYGRFVASDTSDGQDVFYASVDVPALSDLQHAVSMALMEAGCPPSTAHGYTPHVTLAYVESGAKNPAKDVPPLPLKFEAMTIVAGTRRIDIPFMPAAVATFAVRESPTSPTLHVYQPLGFAEPPEWAPFLPVPGRYAHPLYGELDFSPEAYDRLIGNFKSGVYQERIPVNAEHDVQASGAVGWITDMRRADDGGVDVRVEWNDRGRALIEGDRFRYVSAEVYDVWTDPVSGDEIPHVAVGMAICTNPYFKESVLRPLAASEAALTRVAAPAAVAATEPDTGAETPKEPGMSDQDDTKTTTTTAPPVVADDDVKALTERIMAELGGTAKITDPVVQDFVQKAAVELSEARAQAKREAERAKTLSEQNAVLTAQNRVKVFTDEVMGRGAQSGIPYDGHIPDMVRMLCSLANTYGEESWEVTHYKELNRGHAEKIKAGSLFKEIGTARGADATLTAQDQIDALAREMIAANPKLTHAQAFTQVLNSNAELRAAHARERQGGR